MDKDLPDLGDGYKLNIEDCELFDLQNSDNNIIVDDIILDFTFDSVFIIVSQRPWNVPDIPGVEQMTYKEQKEAFRKSTFVQYWIINKKEKCESITDTLGVHVRYSNVYGPFKSEEYLQKREEIGVPAELKLK